MNEAQMLLALGYKPKSSNHKGLCLPALHLGLPKSEIWDNELGGTVLVPKTSRRASNIKML